MNEIKLIDDHLFKSATVEDALLFDALLILNPALPDQIRWQKTAHILINRYSRKKLKAEIEAVHQKIFNDAKHRTYSEQIRSIFS